MLRLKLTIFTLFILTNSFGQKIEKVFLYKNDSSKNCYTIIYPPKLPWIGYIFIIPGFGETAENVLQQTDLPKLTAKSGLLTIIPTFQDGVLSFGIDNLSQQSFNNIILDVREKHKLTDLDYYVGGFSIGGSTAIKFAENESLKPKAVFAIDPPLDFERFYNSAKRDIRLSKDNEANQENVYMVDRIEKETGGSPTTNLTKYYTISPYSFSDTTQRAIKQLIKMPLRIYTEPDINWWLKERGADFTSMNATECSAMINELKGLGNQSAELITTQNKGYRKPDNRRHPHSWSIVDNNELIEWLLRQK
ncbi:alpha/beta hydrolase [Flavobacterium sp. LS1P28]|uniref:alpha/beta hydrolase n=1 Tax=Flavobacterium sp. LS1P28 TaxID=2497752 RepID=UPI000F84C281|nr:alpha/beta hydrolase [Flavobacterium sp. LS1P28]RTY78017.1 alpha/beta hydrolase [Flavobacterium sp. LS1P28]